MPSESYCSKYAALTLARNLSPVQIAYHIIQIETFEELDSTCSKSSVALSPDLQRLLSECLSNAFTRAKSQIAGASRWDAKPTERPLTRLPRFLEFKNGASEVGTSYPNCFQYHPPFPVSRAPGTISFDNPTQSISA
ncbi:hypothetical protein NMY22_g15814 [Coprinellus aureogranulatus]|nr:hypothetical protein NMY22_g15814 [Coprinellus aureogranulatus]